MRAVIVVTGRAHVPAEHRSRFVEVASGLLGGPADVVFHTTSSARRLDPQRGLVPVQDA
jgi:hypothetical protein